MTAMGKSREAVFCIIIPEAPRGSLDDAFRVHELWKRGFSVSLTHRSDPTAHHIGIYLSPNGTDACSFEDRVNTLLSVQGLE